MYCGPPPKKNKKSVPSNILTHLAACGYFAESGSFPTEAARATSAPEGTKPST